VDQPPATTPAAAPAQPQDDSRPLDPATSPTPPGFGSRGRVRRRARFLRKARELAYRDLGGLVFSLHRFGQRNDELVLAKLSTLSRIDAELRALESSLAERQPVTVLREAGITACPRCAAIHSGEDRFCPSCGLPLSRNVDLPIGAIPAATAPADAPATEAMPAAAAPAYPVSGAPSIAAPPSAPSAGAGAPAPASTPTPTAAPVPAPAQPPLVSGAAPVEPATQTHAQPVTQTPAEPATQTHATVAPAGRSGRTPSPPSPTSAKTDEDDEPTEIIRPPAAGS
jgi:hypothetical protein